jgi:hypothetical protein
MFPIPDKNKETSAVESAKVSLHAVVDNAGGSFFRTLVVTTVVSGMGCACKLLPFVVSIVASIWAKVNVWMRKYRNRNV